MSMKSKYICDMTKGNETGLLIRFTIPMLIGNLFQQLYNIVDSIIVGRYVGSDALGAVGAVGNINFIFFALCMGLGAGIGIMIAQYFGAGETFMLKQTIAHAVYIILTVGILVSIAGILLATPVLKLMKTPDANFGYALSYMRIVCGATVVVAVYNGISAILRALGDAKTPLIFLVVACIANVFLDLLFVLEFQMGVAGAAWATILSQCIAAVGSILFAIKKNPYFKLEKIHFKWDVSIVRECCRIGVPVAGQNALIALSCTILQGVVNSYGETIMAAYTATSRVEQLVQQPFNSLGLAVSTFAGQNVGAREYERVNRGCKKAIWLVLCFSTLMIAVMFLFGQAIVSIFIKEAEIIEIGAKGLRVTSLMYIALGMIYIMRGALNGLGDTGYAMINGICEVSGRVVFAFLLMLIPGVGYWCIWYTNGCTWLITGIAGLIRFLQGKWKHKEIAKFYQKAM